MSDTSNIEWTDATWNPTTGCTKVSPGCAHCYIERTVPFRTKHRRFERGHIPLTLHEQRLAAPLRWRKPKRIFVNSLSDLFHPDVPDTFIDRVFAVMALCPQHTFQVLTKRPERMRAYVSDRVTNVADAIRGMDVPHADVKALTLITVLTLGDEEPRRQWPLRNVWLGVSVENQHFADERIPLLLQTPAAVRFISAEPLLEEISFRWAKWDTWNDAHGERRASVNEHDGLRMLDWVIVGGESGPGSRTFDLAWARSIVQQCQAAGVACFVKQLGAHVRGTLAGCLVDRWEMPNQEWRQLPIIVTPSAEPWVAETRREAIGGRLFDKKGGDPTEWPSDLRVRQFPEVRS